MQSMIDKAADFAEVSGDEPSLLVTCCIAACCGGLADFPGNMERRNRALEMVFATLLSASAQDFMTEERKRKEADESRPTESCRAENFPERGDIVDKAQPRRSEQLHSGKFRQTKSECT